jgi:hypothetical protein
MKPEFLRSFKTSMKEHPLTAKQRKDVSLITESSEDNTFGVVIHTDPKDKKITPLGVLWFDDQNWRATMGFCWVGTYKKLQDAMDNIIIAYFG